MRSRSQSARWQIACAVASLFCSACLPVLAQAGASNTTTSAQHANFEDWAKFFWNASKQFKYPSDRLVLVAIDDKERADVHNMSGDVLAACFALKFLLYSKTAPEVEARLFQHNAVIGTSKLSRATVPPDILATGNHGKCNQDDVYSEKLGY